MPYTQPQKYAITESIGIKGKLLRCGTYGSVYEAINRLCATKEVDIIPDDTKSYGCIRQLELRVKLNMIEEYVVRNFTRHILSGLVYLHSKKIFNMDIKGANLLVDAYRMVKLANFELAKYGSPHCMDPEVLQAVLRKDANMEDTIMIYHRHLELRVYGD
ncbi:unnamed protein product [Lactuca virosa]|uniref:Protein kinase domain-containing protein n=1 Tax=Lactuca virosa TaxID=75947 RepID=A0AAU9P0B2_9ASTR|nr:unnamed protein product [Lactuca virosa]